jgi:polysaccharide export outer membrane protein
MKPSITLFVVCVLSASLAGTAGGAPATNAPATNRPAVSETYILGPGDQIEISIFGEPDLSRTSTIKPDGTIALALVNEVKAAGKTTAQLEVELTRMYSKYLKTPSVAVIVKEFRIDRVYLLGQVSKPGDYQLRPNVGVFELLASAGGPTNRADLAGAVVIRGKAETIKIDLFASLAKNKTPDVKLQAGDVLFIPETDRRIVVLGEVGRPGPYDLLAGQHVTDLLAAAGGVTTKASLPKAFLMRNNNQIPVDLKRVLAGDVAANMAIQPGDMLVVPESQDRVVVIGAVNKPGRYDLSENMTLFDALALAGGPTEKGNLGGIQLVRLEGGKMKTIAVKADQVLQGKDAAQNLKLQSGDFVYVPHGGQSIWDIINNIGVLRFLFGL